MFGILMLSMAFQSAITLVTSSQTSKGFEKMVVRKYLFKICPLAPFSDNQTLHYH